MSKFEFGLNPIWLLPCAMIALGFSLFLYFRYKSIWDAKWNLYLGISRFLGVFALLFLLINPLWRQIENQIVKPKVQIIVDNSESMLLADKDIQSKVKAAIQKINSSYKDVQLELFDLDKKLCIPSITVGR